MAGSSAGSIFVDLLLRDANYNSGWNKARRTTTSSAAAISSSIKSIALSISGIAVAREIIRLSDEFAQLEGRLSLVARSANDFISTQERLFQVAQATRTDLSATVTLYQRLTSATKGLGISQEEIFLFTEQLNKQLITAGVSSNEASAAIFQLTQAFNKGKLDGDEFRTILESAPPILEALERSLGKTRGEILKLSADGKLAPKVLVDAVNQMADVTNARFDQFNLTVGQAFTQLNNSLLSFVGNSIVFQNATANIAQAVVALSRVLDRLSEDADSVNVAINGIIAKYLEFYKVYNQYGIRVQQATNVFGLNDEGIKETEERIKRADELLDALGQNLIDTEDKLKKARGEGLTFSGDSPVIRPSADVGLSSKQMKDFNALLERNREILTGLNATEIRYNEQVEDLNKLLNAGKISQDEYNDALTRAQEQFTQTKDSAVLFGIEIENFSKRAAENIQDAFADFLFDPFEDGLRGMARGFIDTVRRMIAEAQAAQLAKILLGGAAGGAGGGLLGGLLGGFFGSSSGSAGLDIANSVGGAGVPFFADGGYLGPGKWGIAGESGAELLYGGRTGVSVLFKASLTRMAST